MNKRQSFEMIRLLVLLVFCSLSASAVQVKAQPLSIPEPVRFLALGDSYTIGQSVSPSERWPQQFYDSLEVRGFDVDTLSIIATTGWTTYNLMDAISNKGLAEKEYNLVSLLIGVNDQYQGKPFDLYKPQLTALVDSALKFLGQDTSRLFIVSIPDYAFTPFGQNFNPGKISSEIDQYNAVNQDVAEAYGIQWFDVTPISRKGLEEPDLVAPDKLHPSGSQYTRWVELMLESISNPIVSTSWILDEEALSLYPNPCYGKLQVSWNAQWPAQLMVTDSGGSVLVPSRQIDPGKNLTIELPTGLCTLILQCKGQTITRQVAVIAE